MRILQKYWVDAKVSADFFKNFLNDVALLRMRGFHVYMVPLVSHHKTTPINVRVHLH